MISDYGGFVLLSLGFAGIVISGFALVSTFWVPGNSWLNAFGLFLGSGFALTWVWFWFWFLGLLCMFWISEMFPFGFR